MYKRLLSFVNTFVQIERAHLGQVIHCQLLDVTPETIDIQTFSEDGREDTRWIIPLASVTGLATQNADIDRLALTVKWAQSSEDKTSEVTSEV